MSRLINVIILVFLYSFSSFATDKKPEVICTFCSADDKIPDIYKESSYKLGQAIAINNLALMTGGSKTGLMKEVADGYLSQKDNKHFYGILPSVLKEYEVHHTSLDMNNLAWSDTIHQRLTFFIERCDTIIALPGGWGTLHELMDSLVHKQFGLTKKKIILFNYNGYWDNLLKQFEVMGANNALQNKHLEQLIVVNSIEECIKIITSNETESQHGLDKLYWQK